MGKTYSTMITPDRERGQHLKFEDRCSIQIFRKLGYSLRRIAEELDCSPSTVMYELRRGTGTRNGSRGRFPQYSAKRGQKNYEVNRARCHRPCKGDYASPFIRWMSEKVKAHGWSLDACVGYAKKHHLFPEETIPCTKTLYNDLWAGRLPIDPFDIPEALSRKRKHKALRKNKRIYGTSIEERPEEVMERIHCGHWEIDTVVGRKKGRESVVLTILEKASDYYLAIKIPGKNADAVMAALEVLREEFGAEHFPEIFRTITSDNGSEFERLSELEDYGTTVYFAHPYSSWERAQNERHNRILRRFIPKGVSIELFSAEQILEYADEINALPRRHLGYSTPEEVFDTFLDQVYSVDKVHVVA